MGLKDMVNVKAEVFFSIMGKCDSWEKSVDTNFNTIQKNYYRVSQNYRAPSEILKTIELSPTKEGFITDLMPYPWTHSSSLSCAILIWSWSISINE
jgi:hypothetical protein